MRAGMLRACEGRGVGVPVCVWGHVPADAERPRAGRVLLMGYFYDRVAPLMPQPEAGEELTATVELIAELAGAACLGRDEWLKRWGTQTKFMVELEERPEWCLDPTSMNFRLMIGYIQVR
ncbi:hypothetical protein DFH06DRAFT_1232313 [Mycena polygramma]|nr:hypothetical protein DFH06DRAFT_1232313 [Mycena polygramma]